MLPQCGHLTFLPPSSGLTLRFFPQDAHAIIKGGGVWFVAVVFVFEWSGGVFFAPRNLSLSNSPNNTQFARNANTMKAPSTGQTQMGTSSSTFAVAGLGLTTIGAGCLVGDTGRSIGKTAVGAGWTYVVTGEPGVCPSTQ